MSASATFTGPVGRLSARAEAGAVWLDVVQAAAQHGLAALAGSSPDVGVTGLHPRRRPELPGPQVWPGGKQRDRGRGGHRDPDQPPGPARPLK